MRDKVICSVLAIIVILLISILIFFVLLYNGRFDYNEQYPIEENIINTPIQVEFKIKKILGTENISKTNPRAVPYGLSIQKWNEIIGQNLEIKRVQFQCEITNITDRELIDVTLDFASDFKTPKEVISSKIDVSRPNSINLQPNSSDISTYSLIVDNNYEIDKIREILEKTFVVVIKHASLNPISISDAKPISE